MQQGYGLFLMLRRATISIIIVITMFSYESDAFNVLEKIASPCRFASALESHTDPADEEFVSTRSFGRKGVQSGSPFSLCFRHRFFSHFGIVECKGRGEKLGGKTSITASHLRTWPSPAPPICHNLFFQSYFSCPRPSPHLPLVEKPVQVHRDARVL